MLNIRPKLFNNESPPHYSLRITYYHIMYQIFMIREYVYITAKENSLEFFFWVPISR